MKIGIDARVYSKTHKLFFQEFLKGLKNKENNYIFNIYCVGVDKINNPKINIINCSKFENIFLEQTLFFKKIKNDNNDIIISFDDTFPVFYRKKYFNIANSLENIFYPNFENKNIFRKYILSYIRKKTLENSEKVLCFNEKTKEEINEKINISEKKIKIIDPFFVKNNKITEFLNIKNKHSLTNDYIIYNSGSGNSKNTKKFLEAFSDVLKIKKGLNLIVIGKEISKDLDFRENIINLGITNNIIFTGDLLKEEIGNYFSQAKFIIHPVIYENFCYDLNYAINYNSNILSSELIEIKSIFGNKIKYFNPLYKNEIKNIILEELDKSNKNNYQEILEKYNIGNFINNLFKLI